MLGSVVGIGILTAIFPRQAAEGVGEAILSAAMISAARTARQAAVFQKSEPPGPPTA